MEEKLTYLRVTAEDTQHGEVFAALMFDYIDEMNVHSDRPLRKEFQRRWIDSILAMQGPADRHLELCYVGNRPIGFLYGKVDHEGQKGYIKPGYGYIMEFYVTPRQRRSGCGQRMFARMEQLFRADGVRMMYLTADPVTGKPFWEAMGFVNTGEKSPDNGLYLYEKPITVG